jgi:hypothetical protein
MLRTRRRRPGTAALDTVACAVVLVALAAAGYALARASLERYLFDLGTAVGWPLM